MLTQERLKELLSYDPLTGEWRWIIARGRKIKAGAVAGSNGKDGYRQISVDGRTYGAARLAFLYMIGKWPENEADHRDTNHTNDCWSNLRDATRSQNEMNKPVSSRNKLGLKYISKAPNGKYYVSIGFNGDTIHLGTFEKLEIALEMRDLAMRDIQGEFANA
jgi:hypothetical protein